MRARTLLIVFFTALAACQHGTAETLYGFGDGYVWTVDPTDGSAEQLWSTSGTFANAATAAGDVILTAGFGLGGGRIGIYQHDPATQTSSLLDVLTGIPGSVRGLAMTPDGRLFGIATEGSIDPDFLVEFDFAAGVVHTVAELPGSYQSLTTAPDGSLYTYDGYTDLILSLDPETGAQSVVAAIDPPLDVQTLEFLSDGTLFGGRFDLFDFDLDVGEARLVGSPAIDFRGFAVIPSGGTLFTLFLPAICRSRRRRA